MLELTGRVTPGVRFESSKGPESDFVDRMRPVASDQMRHRVQSNFPPRCSLGCMTRRADPASDQTLRSQTLALRPTRLPVELTGRASRVRSSVRSRVQSPSDFLSPLFLCLRHSEK
jgi:hypothetical protein